MTEGRSRSLLMPLASTIEIPTFFSAVQSLRHNWTGGGGVDAPRQTLQLGTRWRTTDGRRGGDGDGARPGPGGSWGSKREGGKVGEQTGAEKERRDIGALTDTSVLPLPFLCWAISPFHPITVCLDARILKFQQVDIRPAHEHHPAVVLHHTGSTRQGTTLSLLGGRARRYPTFHADGLPDDDPTKQYLTGRAEPDSPVFFRCSSGGPVEGGHGRAGEAHRLVPGPRKHWRTAPSRILDGEVPLARC